MTSKILTQAIKFYLGYDPGEKIKKHSINTHTLLIDDMRLFGKAAHDFITIDEVKNKILEINSNYEISFLNSNVKNDILLAKI